MKHAVILAGGRGTRLRPYTLTLPKPLVPLVDTPIVEIVIRKLANAGYDGATLAINHMGELIQAYFGSGERWGLELRYSLENEPLGTIAPLRLIDDLPDNFLVINADVLSDLDLSRFLADHVASGAIFTIGATSRDQVLDYGVLGVEGERLVNFREKPKLPQLVSMGIYAVNRRVIDYIPPTGPFGFDQLMLKLIEKGEPVNVKRHDGYWLDIGRPDDYERATIEFEKDRKRFL
ncbi:nucleoside-diphosphate-sugar pyrophosphorylase [Bradyrhizobium diazoefficiens]|uniref:nucleotidyltransferase family protein n=1 Tax=Bradyrhizobium diazoefficiens TaxID=1355477 RepID=UPI000BE85239|nr:nucleotidyltransferase family protein [Bradyrhizobium diazoefficiens]PDT58066.1 nucleoside-diphosphate-sugar pyrophosphorylase [Bradyrhizobium diazoefficiens]